MRTIDDQALTALTLCSTDLTRDLTGIRTRYVAVDSSYITTDIFNSLPRNAMKEQLLLETLHRKIKRGEDAWHLSCLLCRAQVSEYLPRKDYIIRMRNTRMLEIANVLRLLYS